MTDQTYVLIYARFSDDKQKNLSIEEQFEECEAYWNNLRDKPPNCEVKRFSDFAISGDSISARPGIISMMDFSKRPDVTHMLSYGFDRLSRSQSEGGWIFEQLEFHRVELHTVRDGRITDMHVAMRGLEGAAFLKKLSMDTKRGVKGAVKRGQIIGARLYGYQRCCSVRAISRRASSAVATQRSRSCAGGVGACTGRMAEAAGAGVQACWGAAWSKGSAGEGVR